ncbi:MAG: hypothetical protein SGARI_007727, partial [Bacillariaceae sp.]
MSTKSARPVPVGGATMADPASRSVEEVPYFCAGYEPSASPEEYTPIKEIVMPASSDGAAMSSLGMGFEPNALMQDDAASVDA